MKFTTAIVTLFAAIAMATPAPVPATEGLFLISRDASELLEKRGCPAGSSCQQGQCWWLNCSSSGWCSQNPSGISC